MVAANSDLLPINFNFLSNQFLTDVRCSRQPK